MSKGDRSESHAANFGLNESLSKHLKFREEHLFKKKRRGGGGKPDGEFPNGIFFLLQPPPPAWTTSAQGRRAAAELAELSRQQPLPSSPAVAPQPRAAPHRACAGFRAQRSQRATPPARPGLRRRTRDSKERSSAPRRMRGGPGSQRRWKRSPQPSRVPVPGPAAAAACRGQGT